MGTHPIFESDFDCLTDFLIKNFQLGLKLNRWMILLRVAPQCLRTLRRTSNYYLYLGVRYNAPTSEISNAIDAKKSEIKRRIGAEEEGASDEFGELDLRRTLGFLKRMEKTLLDDERRKKYNFEQRATLAETIPDFIPPEEFVPEGSEQLLPETFDVADLKAHLFDERVKNQKIKWLPWDLVFRSKDSHSTLAIPEEQEFKRVSK